MATINVKDAAGATVAIEKPLAPGRVAAVASRPVALSIEDLAALTTLAGQGTVVSATFTPAGAAYAANDIMEGAKQFAAIGPSGAAMRILSAELEVDHSAVIAGETSYRLYLYSVTPPSAPADNAAFDLPSGDRASFLGYVDLGTPVDLGATLYVQTADINKDIKLTGTSVFGLLVTNGAFTATAAARKVTLHAVPV
jgi:hypothetical protein